MRLVPMSLKGRIAKRWRRILLEEWIEGAVVLREMWV